MANENEKPQFDEEPVAPVESDQQDRRAEPSAEEAEEVEEAISDTEIVLRTLRLNPERTSGAGEGFRGLWESVSDFFVASDRGAGRTKDTAPGDRCDKGRARPRGIRPSGAAGVPAGR